MTTTDRPTRTTEPTTADERRWWRDNFACPCTEAMRFLIRLLDDLAERDARIEVLERLLCECQSALECIEGDEGEEMLALALIAEINHAVPEELHHDD